MKVERGDPYLSGQATRHQAHSEAAMKDVVMSILRVLSAAWGMATATDTVFV